MIQTNDCVRFLFKPFQALGVAGKAHGQEFERSLPASNNVGGQIDFAHPAGADRFGNFIVANRMTNEQAELSIFDNIRSKAGDGGFDEVPRVSMCS